MSTTKAFMIGDTVMTTREEKIYINDEVPRVIIPAGSKGLIGYRYDFGLGGPFGYKLYFGFKDKRTDLWFSDMWEPVYCRKVLIEKTIPVALGDNDKIEEYTDSY